MRSSMTKAMLLTLLLSVACVGEPEQTAGSFSWEESVSGMRHALIGTCASNGAGIFAVGGQYAEAAVYRFTGRRWMQEGATLGGQRLRSCWAGGAQRVFAVGQAGNIYHHTAEGWFRDTVPEDVRGATLYSVWGMPDGTAVAVGGGLPSPRDTAVILHYDGSTWNRADASNLRTKTLRGVWGVDGHYWAVGDNGGIAHFDGESWQPQITRVDDRLNGVYGTSANEIYAVGGTGRGLILRWNGSSWVHFDEPSYSLQSAWTKPDRALYVAGDMGFVARYPRVERLPDMQPSDSLSQFPHLRVHAITGLGKAILGAAATMDTGDDGDWRGSIVGHGRSFAGAIFESSAPFPREPDAGVPDASSSDAGPIDAAP